MNDLREGLVFVRNLLLSMDKLNNEEMVLCRQFRNPMALSRPMKEPKRHRLIWFFSITGSFLLIVTLIMLRQYDLISSGYGNAALMDLEEWDFKTVLLASTLNVIGVWLPVIIVIAGMVAIGIKIYRVCVKSHNKNVDIDNQRIMMKNEQIMRSNENFSEAIQNIRDRKKRISSIYQENVLTWFPQDYGSLTPVNYFINLVDNHLVSSIQEAVEKYEQEVYRQKKLHNQQMILNQQEELVRQQMLGNMINTANLFTNIGINQAANRNAAANERIASNLSDINRRLR